MWIHHGEKGTGAALMSHHLFDHLLMGTEMLYGVITTFRDVCNNDEFCIQNEEFCIKNERSLFQSKMMNFAAEGRRA